MPAAILCLIPLLALPVPQEPAGPALPAARRVGLAWQRSGALEDEVQAHLVAPDDETPFGLGMVFLTDRLQRRLVVLGSWNDEARAAAEGQELEHVVVLDRARCKTGKSLTKEYGGKDGRTARLRYVGAEWEVRAELCAREAGWGVRGSVSEVGETQPPWTITGVELGDKVDFEADLDVELARAVRRASRELLGREGARLLWERREAWLAAGGEDVLEQTPWEWFEHADRAFPLPMASLGQRARADWTAWQQRWHARDSGEAGEDTCGWCATSIPPGRSCTCADSEAFGALLSATGRLISEGHSRERAALLDGLVGSDPRRASTRTTAIQAALAELPEAFRARLLAPNPSFANRGLVRVVIYAEELPREIADAFDPDLASSIDELAMYGGERLTQTLETWKVRLQMPAAALVRIHDRNARGNAKVLERVNLRTAKARDLEDLFEQALRAALDDED